MHPVNTIAFNLNKSLLAVGAQENKIKFITMEKIIKRVSDEKMQAIKKKLFTYNHKKNKQ